MEELVSAHGPLHRSLGRVLRRVGMNGRQVSVTALLWLQTFRLNLVCVCARVCSYVFVRLCLSDPSEMTEPACVQRNYQTHRPYVGVAVSLSSPPGAVQGHLFCFLPLPLPPETPSPTGLPLHVHGFLELDENRQHVQWPSSDECQTWNRLLVAHALPRAYVTLLLQLVEWSDGGDRCLPW